MLDSFDPFESRPTLKSVRQADVELHVGDAVRLRPRQGADVMDLALEGHIATIEAIEQDYEDRIFLAVTIDDDPGKDLGAMRKPAHRFFFRLEEVEPLKSMGEAER